MAKSKKKHCIVIGAGPAGMTLAVGLTNFGHKVTLIEKDAIGGDCTNTGCIPSKALLHAASLVGEAFSPTEALEYARNKAKALSEEEHKEFSEIKNLTIEQATAYIKDKSTVELTYGDGAKTALTGDLLIIAAGASPNKIDIAGVASDDLLTNETLFSLTSPPEKLAIVGAGPIGVEMATAFQKLGTQVVLFEYQNAVLPGQPPKISALVERSLTSLGVQVFTNYGVESYDKAKQSLKAGNNSDKNDVVVDHVEKILVATGRQPRTKKLGIDNLALETTKSGHIVVDANGRTSVDSVWAVGDISWLQGAPLPGTTSAAGALARRIVSKISLPYVPQSKLAPVPVAVFGSLEVASVGAFAAEPAEHILRIEVDMATTDRYYTDDVKDGFLLVDVEKLTGNIVAAALAGPRSAEVINLFSLAMAADISMYKIFKYVSTYPSYAQAVNKAADIFMSQNFNAVGSSAQAVAKAKLKKLFRFFR